MAVYNGFSTRKKETLYNDLTFDLMLRLQDQILCSMNGKEEDLENWKKGYKGTVLRIAKMEKEKFMPPRYSQACEELNNYLFNSPIKNQSPEKEFPKIQGNP